MVSNMSIKTPLKKLASIKKNKRKVKTSKSNNVENSDQATNEASENLMPAPEVETEKESSTSLDEFNENYPIFKDEELMKKFLNVPLNNNQKGRVRQLLKQQLQDASNTLSPDIIYNKIQSIIKQTSNLTEPELRKIRILYNMLKTTVKIDKPVEKKKNKKKAKKNKKEKSINKDKDNVSESVLENPESVSNSEETHTKDKIKVKGPKRYVVFVGNLIPDIGKEEIMNHFKDISEHIVSVRIPKQAEGRKSAIAYVELKNEQSYELALSKHHSMLGNKRINVLYTTQKKTRVSQTEAKSKSAKLIALQKSGKLAGSVPQHKKRSHRRAKAKRAQAKLDAAA